MPDAKETLKEWCDANKLSEATLAEDGGTLSLGDTSLPAKEKITVNAADGKEVQYSLASVYLQILDPDQGLVKYRGACKKHQVADPVKALDKPVVVGYFLASSDAAAAADGDAAAAAPGAAAAPEEAAVAPVTAAEKPAEAKAPEKERKEKEASASKKRPSSSSSSKHRDHDKHRRDHKKRPASSSSSHKDKHGDKRKKHKSLVTNEQLFSNLNVVVDKRAGAPGATEADKEDSGETPQKIHVEEPKNEEFEAIRKALSPEGFQVTPEMLEAHKEITETLMAHEIPVGDSASILRASSVGANLTRVLNIFLETVNPKLAQKKGITPSPVKKNTRQYLVGQKPIILLPKGMTAPVTILNGYDFFANARFIPRDVMMKNKALQANSKKTAFTRKMPGVGLVEYELLDNPRKLHTKEDWERVVAVLALGHKWQFKDWPGKYNDPVQLFSRTYGFYIGMEGDKLPTDLQGWSCRQGKLHREKRGLDSVTHASFWNGLDDWIKINRNELLPQQEN